MTRLAVLLALTLVATDQQVRLPRRAPTAATVPTIAWSELTEAGDSMTLTTGQQFVKYDPVSGQIFTYTSRSSEIYSNTLMFGAVSGSTITFTARGGTGGGNAGCYSVNTNSVPSGWNNGDGSAVQPYLADRHPETMNWFDSSRNIWNQWSGLACGNPAVGDGVVYRDLWEILSNVTISSVTMSKKTFATTPAIFFTASAVYDPDHDIGILHGLSGAGGGGNAQTWIWCKTSGGTLSAPQIAAGCDAADDWELTYDPGTADPPGSSEPNVVWSPLTHRALMFRVVGASNPWTSTVASYDPEAQTWSNLSLTGAPSNPMSGQHPKQVVALVSSGPYANLFLYRKTCDAAPGCGDGASYAFNAATNTFTLLSESGTGPEGILFGTFAPNVGSKGSWIVYELSVGWWKGELQ